MFLRAPSRAALLLSGAPVLGVALPIADVRDGITLVSTGGWAMRGGGFYDQTGTAERYFRHRHSGTSSPNVVMEEPALLARVGAVTGQPILDLGCGDGSFGAWAMNAGAAAYRGVDASAEMTQRALTRLEEPMSRLVGRAQGGDLLGSLRGPQPVDGGVACAGPVRVAGSVSFEVRRWSGGRPTASSRSRRSFRPSWARR